MMTWQDFVKQYAFVFTITGAFLIFLLGQWIAKNLRHKEFSYKSSYDYLLMKKQNDTSHRMTFLLDNKPVQDAGTIQIYLNNSGNQDIDEKDFVEPISIYFASETEIIEAEVVSSNPKRFKPQVEIIENRIILKPCLMNRKDNLVIKAIIAPLALVKVDGRIKGIPDLTDMGIDNIYRRIICNMWIMNMLGVFFVIIYAKMQTAKPVLHYHSILTQCALLIASVILLST